MRRLKTTRGCGEPMEELSKFEKAAAQADHWRLFSRAQKIVRTNFSYLAYQLSKKRPRKVRALTFWGADFSCYLPDYFLTWQYGVLGDPSEIALTRYFLKNLKANDVFFDIGANCGFYTLLAAHCAASGFVHAFEPTPGIFKMLAKNANGKANIKANQLAVSDRTGEAELSVDPIFSVVNSLAQTRRAPAAIRVPVRTVSVDEYCTANSVAPTFMKIDVEGAEALVVSGAATTLAAHNPIVSLEVLAEGNDEHLKAVSALLKFGYKAHRILPDGGLEPAALSAENIQTFLSDQKGFTNFIFKKPPVR